MLKPYLEHVPKKLLWLLNFAFLNLTWVIFRAPTMTDAMTLYRRLLSGGIGLQSTLTAALEKNIMNNLLMNLGVPLPEFVYIVLLLASSVLLALLCRNTNERIERFRPSVRSAIVVIALLTVSILSLSGVSTFLYFNF